MLTVVTSEKARELILSCVDKRAETASVSLYDACGRICAEDIVSHENLPAFDRSVVDGYAVRACDTYGCSESLPAMLTCEGRILMGEDTERTLHSGCCMDIPTGAQLPKNADAAVMWEHTEDMGDGLRCILKPCAVGENIVRCGDDCRKGDVVVKAGTLIKPENTAVMAALGIASVKTVEPLCVGIISTGDELVSFEQTPQGSQIRDINSVLLASCADADSCRATVYPIVPDDADILCEAIEKAVDENDILLISGGSSAGEKDAVCAILTRLGEVRFHGIAIKPGKPTMFAQVRSKPVFGLPGHPAAAFFTYHLFVRPAVYKMLGRAEKKVCVEVEVSQNIPSNHGREEIMAVRLENGKAIPLPAKSGVVSVLSQADGYIVIGRDEEGILKDSKVQVVLF